MRAPVPARPVACLALAVTVTLAARAAAEPGGDIALDAFRPALDTHGYVTADGTGLTPPGEVASACTRRGRTGSCASRAMARATRCATCCRRPWSPRSACRD